MKLYVAGKWYDRENINEYIKKLEALGHEITHNWTQIEASHDTTYAQLGEFAEADVQGVLNADVLVILLTDKTYPYRGTSVELGVALGANKPVCAVNLIDEVPDFLTMIFAKHKNITHMNSFDELVYTLKD